MFNFGKKKHIKKRANFFFATIAFAKINIPNFCYKNTRSFIILLFECISLRFITRKYFKQIDQI